MPEDTDKPVDRGIKTKKDLQHAFVQGNNKLLIIGVDEYEHCPPLYNAVKDARDLLALLQEEYLFSASPEHTITLFNEAATQAAIYQALEELDRSTTSNDNLLIYFSGHGEFKESIDEGFWIPVDGRLDNHGTFLPFSIFSKYLRAIPTRHTVVIADSCYAGSMFTERKLSPKEQALRRLYGIPSRWLLTAGRNEVVSDGKPGDNSPFADSLLWHLRNHEDGLMSVRDLCQRVITDVSNNARQVPRGEPIFNVGHRGGEFVFIRRGYESFFSDVDSPTPREEHEPRREVRERAIKPEARPEPPKPKEKDSFASVASLKEGLQRHLAASELERVFDLFDKVLRPDGSLADDLILARGQFSALQRDQASGIITSQQAQLRTNQIRHALLYYSGKIEEDDLKPGAIKTPAGGDGGEEKVGFDSLKKEAEVLRKKIEFFKEEMDGLHDLNQRFNLKLQIEEAEGRLKDIEAKLGL